ncbi:MAG: nicotinate-nucleotide--dimethylbenzimidazole phosphoribosyltransferase [Desulfonauticus sp.]|nr:nicotinate-nucleotide--dimethylbenzimidazole phosphoribosyltransferase [Desulfonauticus sp.]
MELEQKFWDKLKEIKPVNLQLKKEAYLHLDNLTKPPRSLGQLEEIAAQLYAIGQGKVQAEPARIYTCAADHGVAEENVSPYPQEVTRQMVFNFLQQGAAINVLCRTAGVDLKVVDVGIRGGDFPAHPNLIQARVKSGTGNIAKEPAMSKLECLQALNLGMTLAEQAQKEGFFALGTGEMGIANTTPSTALFCAFLNLDPKDITGMGAGLDAQGIQKKATTISKALTTHQNSLKTGQPLAILADLGGLEIACLTGLILGAARCQLPVVIDGFISSAAFLTAYKFCPQVKDYAFFAHCSAEQAHKLILDKLKVRPLLHLDMRLGEGTGAALALFLLKAAANIFNQMATFEQAGVSNKIES